MRSYIVMGGSSPKEPDHVPDIPDSPLMAEVRERLANPPSSWRSYAGHQNEVMAIIEMEYRELVQAKASGDKKSIRRELGDLAAACIHAEKSL